MTKEKKKKEVLNIISILSNNKIIYLIDILHLNSNQIFNIRKKFYEYHIQMKVVKNTLLKKALKSLKNKKLDSFFSILKGNTSIITSNHSGNVPSKIIKNFHIKEQMEKPFLKGAYVEESFYFGNKDLDILMKIKSKKDLIIDVLNMLQYPIKQIVLSLKLSEYKIYSILKTL
ncbi:50S ribosomal protein L10 [Blattabacterium cuenoti]|uniref:50S ribosomal protein L10 n=1 Tax=Blattabacterium cuenoti TaxID=1653831 RepID=UPI00163C5DD5|nr:50S ribosomal protein L10 [Blattabacterium cuenoti]